MPHRQNGKANGEPSHEPNDEPNDEPNGGFRRALHALTWKCLSGAQGNMFRTLSKLRGARFEPEKTFVVPRGIRRSLHLSPRRSASHSPSVVCPSRLFFKGRLFFASNPCRDAYVITMGFRI